jgi:hypothetical protein
MKMSMKIPWEKRKLKWLRRGHEEHAAPKVFEKHESVQVMAAGAFDGTRSEDR